MQLPAIPPDPKPTKRGLRFEISQLPAAFRKASAEIQRHYAELLWWSREKERRPNDFLTPFAPPNYETYLASNVWKRIKKNVLARNNYVCICCSGKATEVHHRDYRPRVLSGDDCSALVPICRSCHKRVEDAKGQSWNEGERVLASLVKQNLCKRMGVPRNAS